MIDIEGTFNFRDAGGLPATDGSTTRTGVLYRADAPDRLTAAGRAAVAALGLSCVIDLRQTYLFEGTAGYADRSIIHHIELVDRVIDIERPPSFDGPADLAALYADLLGRGRPQFVKVIELTADQIAYGGVLIHCTAGKDRTGLAIALIQAAIGVEAEAIVADYAASHEPAGRRRAAMIADPLPGDPPVHKSPPAMWTAPAEAMRIVLDAAVTESGSLDKWPLALGVSQAAIDRLCKGLLQ
jgi:protein-tyrosine phosphatase